MVKAPEINSPDQNQQHQLLNKKINQLSMASDVSSSTPTTSSSLVQQSVVDGVSSSSSSSPVHESQQASNVIQSNVDVQSPSPPPSTTLKAGSKNLSGNNSSSSSKNASSSTVKETGNSPEKQSIPIVVSHIATTTIQSGTTVTSTAAIAVVAPTTRNNSGSNIGGIPGGAMSIGNNNPLANLKLNGQILAATSAVNPPQIMTHAPRIPQNFQHLSQFPVPPPGGGGGQWPIVEPVFHFGPGFEPQTRHYCPTHSQGPQPSEHVVFFHVNPGVSVSFQVGASREIVRGEFV